MPGDISGDAQAGGDHASNDGGYGSAAADSSGGTVDAAAITSSPNGAQMAFASGVGAMVVGAAQLATGNPLGAVTMANGLGAVSVAVASGQLNPGGPGPSLADAQAVGGGFNAFAADMTPADFGGAPAGGGGADPGAVTVAGFAPTSDPATIAFEMLAVMRS